MSGRVLNQTVVTGGRVYNAGTPEADVDAKVPDKFWDGEAGSSDSGEPGYGDLKVEDLEAEVAKRNAERDDADAIEVTGTGKDGKVLKKDLVAALEADDEA